ncbi:MAG: hypothetical protein DI582_01040 [Azospirillum brasilense]|nr:MAG: hypothetical protein DI582_01040 [Azospirillum brasilense]
MRIVTKEPEAHLIELLNIVQENRQGWQAVAFNFSKLLEHYRSEYQIKIATNLMNDLLGDRDGAIYLCEDANIYVMVRSMPKPLMDKMMFQLRYLFMDDPLSYSPDGDENPEFCALFEIEEEWDVFMALCKKRLVMRVRQNHAQQKPAGPAATAAMAASGMKPMGFPRAEMKYFTASSLATIEATLKDTDIVGTVRRQPVVAYMPDNSVRTVFDEMYINIAALRAELGTEIDLLSNRWLFKYLTQRLDERMLDAIQKNPVRYLTNPVSLNLNVPTLLSNRFAEFDAAIKPSTKVSLVIELQIGDVLTDMSGFLLAKDTVQKLGYRVCLDGVTDLSFPQIDRKRLGFDLIKLQWNGDHARDATNEKNARVAEAIKICGSNRVILTRCDNEQAIEYGKAVGLSLFQGRYLDSLLNPDAVAKN